MKILQICPGGYQTGVGGVSEHVKNISERLAKKHDVTVYATNPAGSLPWQEIVNGVKVQRFKRIAPSGSYHFSPEMIVDLQRSEFEVVHGHSYHSLPMHFSFLSQRAKLVVSTHFHGVGHSAFRNCLFKLFKPLGKITLLKADKIIAVSEFEKRLLCEQFGIDSDKVVVIPNGLDLSEFFGLKRHRRGHKSILYVGRLESYKGVQFLIEVLPRLNSDVVLEIVGRGSLKSMLEHRVEKLRLNDRVFFFQDISRNELLQKYADADVFVLLSMYEAYSLVVAEALVAGTPCIVSNASALSEWIDNKNCFGIDYPLSISKLAELIAHCITLRQDSDFRIGRTKRILDWNEVVARLENVYADAA